MKQRGQFRIANGGVYRDNHNHDSQGDYLARVPDGMTVEEALARLSKIGSLAGLSLERKRDAVRMVLAGEDASSILNGDRGPTPRRPGRPRLTEEPVRRVVVELTDADRAVAAALGDGNVTAGIRRALAEVSGKEGK